MSDINFKIGEKCLYMDEELVEFNIPVFFICQDEENQKYAVLCSDSEQLVYIVCKVSIKDILLMLNSKITLREFFLKADEKWRICAGEDYLSDEVQKIEKLREDELPVQGTYFELSNSKIINYVKRLSVEDAIIQYNVNFARDFLCYRMPCQVMEIYIDNKVVDPVKYTNKDSYFRKEVVCYG